MPMRGGDGPEAAGAFTPVVAVQGAGVALVLGFLASLVMGMLLGLTDWEASPLTLRILNYVVTATAGFAAGRRAARWGWLHGGVTGLLYAILTTLMFVEELHAGVFLRASWLGSALVAFLAGALGGSLSRAL